MRRAASLPTPGGDAPTGPVRTCIGCRERAAASELIRFVADPTTGLPVIDPARTAPGRGAHLHPDDRCLATALKRRAFTRALRTDRLDPDAVREQWARLVTASIGTGGAD